MYLGNLDSLRDWGHARDYVRAMHLMLQQDEPGDYVIATGQQHSVREFCDVAFAEVGIAVSWQGAGQDEVGVVEAIDDDRLAEACGTLALAQGAVSVGDEVVGVDKRYYRPTDVNTLLGDPSKARDVLGWTAEIGFRGLVEEMIAIDLDHARRFGYLLTEGFSVPDRHE